MTTGNPGYRWMATLLELLLERFDVQAAATLLQDFGAREQAFRTLSPDLVAAGMPSGMLTTPEGQNLFVAVLALRLKFPPDEARQKVQLNITMREGGSPRRT